MSEPFKLLYTPEAREGITAIPLDLKRIAERVLAQIAAQPQAGKRLSGKLKGIFSERVTRRYRILYLVRQAEKEVIVLDFKHRKDAYE